MSCIVIFNIPATCYSFYSELGLLIIVLSYQMALLKQLVTRKLFNESVKIIWTENSKGRMNQSVDQLSNTDARSAVQMMLQEMSTTDDERNVRSCTISAAGDFPHDLTRACDNRTGRLPELFTGKRRYVWSRDVTGDLACCDTQRKYEIKNNIRYCHEGRVPNLH